MERGRPRCSVLDRPRHEKLIAEIRAAGARIRLISDGDLSAAITAALRGTELEAQVVLKATRVDGVYSADPEVNEHAVKYDKLSFDRVIKEELRVMDIGAFEMCRRAKLPILVFNYKKEHAIEKAIAGQRVGTIVGG